MNGLFMLDTDSISFALRGQGQVNERMVQHRPADLCMSAISLAELRFGADRRNSRKLHASIDRMTGILKVMPFDGICAARFGMIAHELARRGVPIAKFDLLIAAHAIAIGATLVTNNVRDFARVPGLRVENWF